MASALFQLSELITTSVAELVDTCTTNGMQLPNLNEPLTSESELFRTNATAARAANNIAAAALQLAACVLPPQESIMQLGSGHNKSAALRVAMECHVPEILREAGGQGLHADDIASKTGIDGKKLARLLRLLANRHMFRETQPDVFANNRISSALDTGKSLKDIMNNPEAKHDNTDGKNAFVEILVSDIHKATSYIMENFKDPTTSRSEEPHEAPIQRALGIRKSYFELLAEPDQGYRRRRFGVAMAGFMNMESPGSLLKLFDWGTLPKDALIVDVGGGIGSTSRLISKTYPNINFVIQDSPSVAKDAIDFWNNKDPEAMRTGRVKIAAHDFFTPQPITNASMFLLKNILHDWSEDRNITILSHLRHAATSDTLLLILDAVMVPSTKTDSEIKLESISGTQGLDPPSILSTGYASVTDLMWSLDIGILAIANGREHTVHQFERMLAKTGWKIVKVVRSGGAIDSVLAKPMY